MTGILQLCQVSLNIIFDKRGSGDLLQHGHLLRLP